MRWLFLVNENFDGFSTGRSQDAGGVGGASPQNVNAQSAARVSRSVKSAARSETVYTQAIAP